MQEAARLDISPTLRARMKYAKFASHPPRMLVGRSRYWVDDACIRAAASMGWEIRETPMLMEGVLSRDLLKQLFESIVTFRPDFILTANLAGMDFDGILARFYADLEIPHATWFVDEPRSITLGKTSFGSPYAVAFTWERAYVPYLEALGFAAVHHLPLAADTALFDAEPASQWTHDVTFVGSSMENFAREAWERMARWPDLSSELTKAFEAGRVTRKHFGEGLHAIVDPVLLESVDEHARRQAELVCFVEGTRQLRRGFVNALRETGLEVRGDNGWRNCAIKTGAPVDYADELPAFYRESRINLNVTSVQMPTAVNQRVFDCPAAGGFLLTDAQADLNELFAPDEVERFATFEEAAEKIRYFASRDAERVQITQAARRRILAEHTYAHRLNQIVTTLADLFAG